MPRERFTQILIQVMCEMKSYIGANDETIELLQKQRGFKSYRDLYNKKIMEQEHFTKSLKETQKEVKVIYFFEYRRSTNQICSK